MQDYLKLYLILETSALHLPLADFIVQAVEGGVSAVQLRDKALPDRLRYQNALSLAPLIKNRDVLFIINNTVDIALAVGADGVHLGPHDLPLRTVRAKFPGLLTGASCNNVADADCAMSDGADYAGIGPAYSTATKPDHRAVLGISGVKELASRLNIPSVAIGGIDLNNAHLFSNTAVCGLAVSSALCASAAPYDTAYALRQQVESFNA